MSTTGKEYKLAIRIAGVIDKSFTASLVAANKTLKSTITSMDKDFTTLDKGFDKIVSVEQKCFSALTTAAKVAATAITAAMAVIGVEITTVGVEFESAFAGVKKTVEATEEEYEQLRQDILDMTKEIPSSASEIAGVMEIAGQLGIAKESLTDFTETMINLGVSTNLSAEDAATALAKIANITNMADYGEDGVSNYERLGSVVVDLGNKFATTEEDIVSLATNLAAAGELAGLTEAQIMGISTAISSVGMAPEAGGSSMSTTLMTMQRAVAKGKEELDLFAETAGVTSKEFAAMFKEDASEALVAFLDGLGKAGDESYDILEELGLSTIRVRKTLLALANSDGLLVDAIDLANEAWEENTALAIEAGKRYETTESKMQLMKNALSELGIVAYDDMQEPFVDVIGIMTDKVNEFTDYVDGPNGISEWLDNIGTALPTLQRKFKKYGEPVFDGLMGAGKWVVKNGKGIISVIAGIGAAMAAYKVASTSVHLVKSLMSLASMNPVTLGILGVVAAIGALTAAYVAYKQHEQELIDNNLAEHFGNISLSMEELQAVAEHILGTGSLGGVKEALEKFEDLETISDTMENALEEINKMNWKVSIGMELTEDEQESYKAAIEEYVTSAQEYALQSQYAVSLNLSMGMEDTAENADIISKVEQFYQDSYDEMTSLGQSLSDAVNEAFADNILDPEEIDEIANIQAKIAELQQSLATGEFDATLSMLSMEYAGGGSLTAESFQNLQAELANQVAEAKKAYEESYAKNFAAIQATYDAGGYLTEEDYKNAIAGIKQTYLENTGELLAKSINFQLETIMQQYAEELDPAIADYIGGIQEVINSYDEYDWETDWDESYSKFYSSLYEAMQKTELDKTTRGAIQELLDAMAPTMEDMEKLKQQYSDMGIEMSEAMAEGLYSFNLLSVLADNGSGDFGLSDGISDGIDGSYIAGQVIEKTGLWDDFYQELFLRAESSGYVLQYDFIEKGVTDAAAIVTSESINAAAEAVVEPTVEGMYAWSQETIDEYYSKGFTATADLAITLNPKIMNYSSVSNYISRSTSGLGSSLTIGHRANGGLATRPELTWFAEKSPEMAIPIDGSQNAISLWEQTGRLLGMDSKLEGLDLTGGSNNSTIEYKPTLQFYGEAPSKSDLTDALKISQDEFETLMERYLKTQGRVAFG